jgi:predicted permease
MLKAYFTIAWRNLSRSRVSAIINIGGLAVGMAVALLIGLWIHDELSFDKNFTNYDRIGKLWQFVKFGPEKSSYDVMPIPLAADLRQRFPDFQTVCLVKQDYTAVLTRNDNHLSFKGTFAQPGFADMLSLHMLAGSRSLAQPNTMLLAASTAKALFGDADPIGKLLKVNNQYNVTVTGVYPDLPGNSSFKDVAWLAPWDLYVANDGFTKSSLDQWDNNSWNIYAQLKPGAGFAAVSAKIKDARVRRGNAPKYNPEFFVFPMRRWHLYRDFKDGVNTGGSITYVWLFGIIGVFVLLLACINFMNLSTARSERRAKEVGIRKAIGSLRRDLITQFLTESILLALIAFALSVLLAQAFLPFFNDISEKQMTMPWSNPIFWGIGLGFSGLTGLLAGSYPALYLSSFRPVKVLKGAFKAGRLAALPRKVLVVLQFTVSTTLIIGTVVVFRQIQYVRSQATGYDQQGLIEVDMTTPQIGQHLSAVRDQLLQSGAADAVSASGGTITEQSGGTTDFKWEGKDPNVRPLVMGNTVTAEYGRTVGWHLLAGSDFSGQWPADSAKMIINEAAAKLIGAQNPLSQTIALGQTITRGGDNKFRIIGIVGNMIREIPFDPVKPTFFIVGNDVNTFNIRLARRLPVADALAKVAKVFKTIDPASPFSYRFVNEAYGRKFAGEERLAQLAGFFSLLAIFISCLGLFGLVSFVAEQRTREIGVRKVLGAGIFNVWSLLSREFILLVGLSLLVAIPIAWHYMRGWLDNYAIQAPLSWWIFAAAAAGALVITLATISVQAIKAALMNPVKALRSE